MRMLLSIFATCALVAHAHAAATSQPNIIFILADDLGYGDLGSYGQREISTPRLDQLASQGMRFTDAYAGSTVCAPSRCVLMTGRHVGNARIRGNRGGKTAGGWWLLDEDVTVAEVLKGAGYATSVIGKWGLGEHGQADAGLPVHQGFDHFLGYLNHTHAHNSYPTHLWGNGGRVPLANTVPDERPNGAGVSDNMVEFAQDYFIRDALEFIRTRKDRPFFLYFAPTIPHANNESRPFGLEVPSYGFYDSRDDWSREKKAWAAMITRLDYDVGRILDLLADLGLEQNTLILFSSDNGPHKESGGDPELFNSSGPLQGYKRSLHDGGIRVPTIARWPGRITAGSTTDAPWHFADVLPTLAAAAGAKAPSGIDGLNTLPTLLGKQQAELRKRFLYWEFSERGYQQAARRGQWKAVKPAPGAPLALYDLSRDPGETTDLATSQPKRAREFAEYLATARSDSPFWPVP